MLEVDPNSINVLVSLDAMFPDKELEGVKKAAARRRKRREREKAKKLKAATADDAGPAAEEVMEVNGEKSYRHGCSR